MHISIPSLALQLKASSWWASAKISLVGGGRGELENAFFLLQLSSQLFSTPSVFSSTFSNPWVHKMAGAFHWGLPGSLGSFLSEVNSAIHPPLPYPHPSPVCTNTSFLCLSAYMVPGGEMILWDFLCLIGLANTLFTSTQPLSIFLWYVRKEFYIRALLERLSSMC